MCQFYNTFCNEKWSTMSTVLTWSHYTELLSIKIERKLDYYLKLTNVEDVTEYKPVEDIRMCYDINYFNRVMDKKR